MYRIMGKAGCKHVISVMQGDGMTTYIQHSKIYVEKITSQHNEISDK